MVLSKEIQIISRPKPNTNPQPHNFRVVERDIDLDALSEGEIAVKTEYLSLDPWLRFPAGFEGDQPRASTRFANNFKNSDAILELGSTYGGRGVGYVIKSKNLNIKQGDLVAADWEWREIAVFNPDKEVTFEKLDKAIFGDKISSALGVLGVSGSHAYYGVTEALKVKPGDVVVISSAAGSIGVIVGYLVQALGATAVGIAGGPEKCAQLIKSKTTNYAIDYKALKNPADILEKLKEIAPHGVDKYFDNVGGPISDHVLSVLKPNGKYYICGRISQYIDPSKPDIYWKPEMKGDQTVVTGMDLAPIYLPNIPTARDELHKLILANKLSIHEYVAQGIENTPQAFADMFAGKNFGKAIVRV
eukprot:TRINITY_DN1758_c0_g1_i7.p1 TRINITY_DN1758_c0_g1~~TRINITY_DN1758_c0_g1_i7.p1  ORF type:complete len:360 (-),score=83.23 TRINITY_DN1758_c0_g1_i7:100-1179(-)